MEPNLIALAIPLFFLGIGVELWIARQRGRSVYRLGDTLADLGCGIGQQLVSALIATSVGTASYEWVARHRLVTLPGTVLPWVVAFFGVELAYYWWHRLSHEVSFLWAAHAVHHQSEDYNLAVALRQSVTTWLTALPFHVPLALIGVPTTHFLVTLGVSTLYQFWVHTELVPPLGWLERIFSTPALHRVHHAINPRYINHNHGAIVSFWDQLFGTYQRETEPCVFGTTRPLNSFNPLWAQVEAFVDLWRLARRAPNLLDAARVFVESPSWRPAWMGEAPMRDFARKYDPPVGQGLRRYALAQWGAIVLVVFAFLLWGAGLSVVSKAAVSAFITLTLATIPALLETRSWAKPLEAVRLVMLPALITILAAFG